MEKQMLDHGSVLASMALPAVGSYLKAAPDKKEFDISRRLEYTLMAKNLVLTACALIFLLMFTCLLSIGLLHCLNKEEKAFFPMPRAGVLLRHLVLTLLLPLVFYEVYKLMPFSSHAWSLNHSAVYLVSELLTICFLIPLLSIIFMAAKNRYTPNTSWSRS